MPIIVKAPYWHSTVDDIYENVTLGRGIVVYRNTRSVSVRFLGAEKETLINQPFIGVSCGINHALLLSADFKLYSIGSNRHGQCGHDSGDDGAFQERLIASNVCLIAAGPSSSFYTSEDGKLFALGNNDYGQLGVPNVDESFSISSPTAVNFRGNITALSSGYTHTCFISGGVLYGCGFNSHGQLDFLCGRNKEISLFSFPEKSLSFVPVRVSCGTWNTAVVSADGNLYICGQAPRFQVHPQGIPEIIAEHENRKARRATFEKPELGFQRLPFDAVFADVAVGSSIALALLSDLRTIWIIDLAELDVAQKIQQEEFITHFSVCGQYYSFST